jgi:hypothetical protein
MPLTTVLLNLNLLAVLAAGFAHMATGLLWFMPTLFGKQWMELTKQDLKPARQWIAAGIIGHQLIALVLAMVVNLSKATGISEGIIVGL